MTGKFEQPDDGIVIVAPGSPAHWCAEFRAPDGRTSVERYPAERLRALAIVANAPWLDLVRTWEE